MNTQLLKKGVYPYQLLDFEYITDFHNLQETLSYQKAFYSSLTEDAAIPIMHKMYGISNLKTLADYHDLYVKVNVLLLSVMFQNFKQTYKVNYDLDCAHLFTSAGISWKASLKMTDIRL